VKVLLDSHTFLWFIEGSPDLSGNARQLIEDAGTTTFLSIASIWEMAIKVSLGKLTLRQPFARYVSHHLAIDGFVLLNITVDHTAMVTMLPFGSATFLGFDVEGYDA
jgi:PIN domain nuclease of toxin-antitoxin system